MRTVATPRRSDASPTNAPTAAPTGEISTGNTLTARTLPKTGIVLVGTGSTCRALAAMIGALDGRPPVLAGWVDTAPGAPASADPPDPALPRLGATSDLPLLVTRLGLRCAVACLPASEADALKALLRGTGLDLRLVPPFADLLAPTTLHATPAPESTGYTLPTTIDLGALIGRTPHTLDRAAVSRILSGKRILITGAGGSIGSELAAVAASFAPERLILMERAENALFEIDRRMAQRYPAMGRRAVLHDVTDAEGTARLLAELRPHVVFHAAAHKHVPLMEDHPGHAITNNLFGTKSIADAAVAAGAERFVMISSDKAVNPTSVMGATKRLAELYIRGLGPRTSGATRLSMVRFGNVLGSACSVLTIWSTQIAEALSGAGTPAPLTITDPRMTRYFMTIPEAATLVIQSMVVREDAGTGVGVYVLDMGDPIRIVELAQRFIRAHGLWPRSADLPEPPLGAPAIDLVFTGARPGEKLHEELAYAAESLRPTDHPGVRAWAGSGFAETDAAGVHEMVAEMASIRFSPDHTAILAAIRRHVPEMRRP